MASDNKTKNVLSKKADRGDLSREDISEDSSDNISSTLLMRRRKKTQATSWSEKCLSDSSSLDEAFLATDRNVGTYKRVVLATPCRGDLQAKSIVLLKQNNEQLKVKRKKSSGGIQNVCSSQPESLDNVITTTNRGELSQKKKSPALQMKRTTSNNLQLSQRADLSARHSGVTKPLASLRINLLHKQNQKKNETDLLKVKRQKKTNQLGATPKRRSSRIRFCPMQSWRNQHPRYRVEENGEICFLGIDEGTKDCTTFSIRRKKTTPRLTISDKRMDDGRIKKFKKLKWHISGNRPVATRKLRQHERNVQFAETFRDEGMKMGFIKIKPYRDKPMQVLLFDAVFVVMKGIVEVMINLETDICFANDTFMVPRGKQYSISNLKETDALLHYFVTGGTSFVEEPDTSLDE